MNDIQLEAINGYTVDEAHRQFRRESPGIGTEVIAFDSPAGMRLLVDWLVIRMTLGLLTIAQETDRKQAASR